MPYSLAQVTEAGSLGLVLDHAPVIVFATDRQGRITLCEGQGLAALGLTSEQAVGQLVMDVYRPQGDASELIGLALAGEAASRVLPWDDRYYHVHLQPLHDPAGKQVGLTGVAVDITVQVQSTLQAETLLRLSELLDDTEALPTLHDTMCAALEALTRVMPLDYLMVLAPHQGAYRAIARHGARPVAAHAYDVTGVDIEEVLRATGGQPACYWAGEDTPAALRVLGLPEVALVTLTRPAAGKHGPPSLLCACRAQDHHPWTPSEQTLVQAAARSIAVIQARRRQLESLEDAAFTDSLTGVGNRRAFEKDFTDALAHAQREQVPLGLLITDLNDLKAVNDQQGHDRGDAVLRAFAHTLRDLLRDDDRCYRLGGDEFAALLPTMGAGSIPAILSRLERALGQLQTSGFPEASASTGIAAFSQEAPDAEALVRLADQRMYQAKAAYHEARRSGRSGRPRRPGRAW